MFSGGSRWLHGPERKQLESLDEDRRGIGELGGKLESECHKNQEEQSRKKGSDASNSHGGRVS